MILCLVLLRACMIDSSHVTFELSLSFLSRTAIAPYCALQVTQQVFMLRQAWAICFCFHSFNACPGENILFSFLFLFQTSPFRSMDENSEMVRSTAVREKDNPLSHLQCDVKAAAVIFPPIAEAASRAQITKWIPSSAADLPALPLTSPLPRLPNPGQTHQYKS